MNHMKGRRIVGRRRGRRIKEGKRCREKGAWKKGEKEDRELCDGKENRRKKKRRENVSRKVLEERGEGRQ